MPLTLPKPKMTDDFVVPDPGVYILEFVGFDDPEPSKFNPEQLTVKLKFNIIDDEYGGIKVNEYYTLSTHESSKLYPVLKALNGGIEIDFEEPDENGRYPDLDDFVGRQVMGTLSNVVKPRKNGNPGETSTFAKIVATAPMKRKKRPESGSAIDRAAQNSIRGVVPPPPPPSTWDDEDEDEA